MHLFSTSGGSSAQDSGFRRSDLSPHGIAGSVPSGKRVPGLNLESATAVQNLLSGLPENLYIHQDMLTILAWHAVGDK